MTFSNITTCLWFDTEAEEAAKFYTSIFPKSEITNIQYYTSVGQEFHKKEPGSVMIVFFTLNGHPFCGLNGGADYFRSAATSFIIECKDQAEVDHYWEKLGEGGDESKKVCGWLADKYDVSWQVNPKVLEEYMRDSDQKKVDRVMAAMLKMKKMDIEELKKAYEQDA